MVSVARKPLGRRRHDPPPGFTAYHRRLQAHPHDLTHPTAFTLEVPPDTSAETHLSDGRALDAGPGRHTSETEDRER